jgi:hypothetical protein
MTVPADGIARLIHFVDARIAQLNLSKEEVARRGGPNRDTLAKIRDRKNARSPSIDTLLRLDQALGWQPGSSAVTLIGGRPLSLNAVGAGVGRPRKQDADRPVTSAEIQRRLADQLTNEIDRLEKTRDSLDERIDALRTLRDRYAAEIIDPDLIAVYNASYKASETRRKAGRRPSAAS